MLNTEKHSKIKALTYVTKYSFACKIGSGAILFINTSWEQILWVVPLWQGKVIQQVLGCVKLAVT